MEFKPPETLNTSSFATSLLTLDKLRDMASMMPPRPRLETVITHPIIMRELAAVQKRASVGTLLHGFGAVRVQESEYCVKRVQKFKPRTKKKRIQKKAIKRYGYIEIPVALMFDAIKFQDMFAFKMPEFDYGV